MRLALPCAVLLLAACATAPAPAPQPAPAPVVDEEQARVRRVLEWQLKNEIFMREVAQRPGVTCTASGLCYEKLVPGKGAAPGPTARVTITYTETLMDGTYVDSSKEHGGPITFPVDKVIPGFTEAVRLLRPGGSARFYIPASLGYAGRGAGTRILPWSALVFDIQLLRVEKP